MIFIPAIDLIDGKCVRLDRGDYSKKKEYSSEPVEVAKEFVDQGASYLHIVDLDAAKDPELDNLKTIGKIVRTVNIPVEVGGGIRDKEKAEKLFDIGVDRIIIGTLLVKNPELVREITALYTEKVAAGIDAKDGKVYISGWTVDGGVPAIDMVYKAKNLGIKIIVYTDIKRDGTLIGPNLEGIKRIANAAKLPVVAAGGIHSIEDLRAIKHLEPEGVIGVISGKAIYEGKITVREAVHILE